MIPYNRHALWHNPLDPEQNYGIIAMTASSKKSFTEYRINGSSAKIQMWGSEAHLYLRIKNFDSRFNNLHTGKIFFGFDTYSKDKGIFTFPNISDFSTPTGMESLAVIDLKENSARVFNTSDYNIGNNKFSSSNRVDQSFDPIMILINAAYTNEEGRKIPAYYTDWGKLHTGPLDQAHNSFYIDDESITIRIPWGLLNVTDPSEGSVLNNPDKVTSTLVADQLETTQSRQIQVYGVLLDEQNQILMKFPEITYTWEKWDRPVYAGNPKKSVSLLSEYFSRIK